MAVITGITELPDGVMESIVEWLENAKRGVCASAAILSLPAFMIIQVASGNPSPTRPTVIRGLLSITLDVGMIAICLTLPRAMIPFLRPGALASRGVS